MSQSLDIGSMGLNTGVQGVSCRQDANSTAAGLRVSLVQFNLFDLACLAGGGRGPGQGCGGAAAAGHFAREDAGAEAGAAGHLLHPHGRTEVCHSL